METKEFSVDDIIAQKNYIPKAELKQIHRIKYLDWRYLTNSLLLIPKLLDDAKAKEFNNEQKERKERKLNSKGLFSSFIYSIASLGRKPKSDDYYNGYKMGALDAIDLCKHYFISNAISKEKQDKLLKFLHDEGIFICTNANTGNVMFGNMYKAGEFYEYEIIYK